MDTGGMGSFGTLEYYTDYGTAPNPIAWFSNSEYMSGDYIVLEPALPTMQAPPGYVFAGWFDAKGMEVIANVTNARDIQSTSYIDPFGSIYTLYARFYKIYYIQSNILTDIADAVRKLNGTSDKYTPKEMASMIDIPYEETYTTATTRMIQIGKGGSA